MRERPRAAAFAAVLATLVAVLVAGGVLVARYDRDRSPVDRIVLAAGPPGSTYEALGRALADAIRQRWRVPVDVRATGGSVDNLGLVGDGQAQLGFATLDVAEAATQGDVPFPGAQAIAPLAALYDDYLHIVVPARSTIRGVSDLAGRRVSLGSASSGTPVIAQRVLAAAGLTLNDVTEQYLDTTRAAEALRAGKLDAIFLTGGPPERTVSDLSARLPIRLVPVTDAHGRLSDESGAYYHERFITAGTYRMDTETATIGVANVLVVPQALPDDVAEALTALLFEARPQLVAAHAEARHLDPRAAIAVTPLTLHPGAVRYYQHAKPLAAARGRADLGGWWRL